jgi:hypothetical protein
MGMRRMASANCDEQDDSDWAGGAAERMVGTPTGTCTSAVRAFKKLCACSAEDAFLDEALDADASS